MFRRLRSKWNVNLWNLFLIISTFAIGGSLCGYTGRKMLLIISPDNNILWALLYIILITLLWPLCVLIVSVPLGQFTFFKKYILKIRNKLMLQHNPASAGPHVTNAAIFASGAGTNAKKIIEYFRNSPSVKILLIVCNRPGAGVIKVAEDNNIDLLMINKDRLGNGDYFLKELKKRKVDFIILAGFLLKIPPAVIRSFPKKIINIHPALLPAHGGKGMYGMNVHEAVIAGKDKQSGISIHYVDEIYDHGELIFQSTCEISPGENAVSLAEKIHLLEHEHYPPVIDSVLKKQKAS